MVGLLKHLQLVFVQLLVDFVDLKRRFFDCFDCARYLGLSVDAEVHRSESSCTNFFPLGVILVEFLHLLERLVLFEAEKGASLLLLLLL